MFVKILKMIIITVVSGADDIELPYVPVAPVTVQPAQPQNVATPIVQQPQQNVALRRSSRTIRPPVRYGYDD